MGAAPDGAEERGRTLKEPKGDADGMGRAQHGTGTAAEEVREGIRDAETRVPATGNRRADKGEGGDPLTPNAGAQREDAQKGDDQHG